MKICDVKTVEITQEKYEKLVEKSTKLDVIVKLIKNHKYLTNNDILEIAGVKEVFTDDPVRDMEDYYSVEREHIDCDICHLPIYKADDIYEGDYVYKIDGLYICEYCIKDYVEKYREELE